MSKVIGPRRPVAMKTPPVNKTAGDAKLFCEGRFKESKTESV